MALMFSCLQYMIDVRLNLVLNMVIDFVTYNTDNAAESKSGAYLFIPKMPGEVMALPSTPNIQIIRGPLVQEITVHTPLVNHTVRLHRYPMLFTSMRMFLRQSTGTKGFILNVSHTLLV
ncbi:unnamed protein product [Echinostoma caproni]|uniref:Secreted protein n=1 Tax=Echinostoma caproni TaxID=27848 RepID=A0A183B307_9TREM|nr:unnamed protein product [Echinostoma caproni]